MLLVRGTAGRQRNCGGARRAVPLPRTSLSMLDTLPPNSGFGARRGSTLAGRSGPQPAPERAGQRRRRTTAMNARRVGTGRDLARRPVCPRAPIRRSWYPPRRMAMSFQHLFTSFRLGHVTLRDRIVSTPHATRFGRDGYITERYIRYHQEKARGGTGLVQCFGSASVHPSSPVLDWNGIKNSDDSSVPTFEAFARAIHAEGAHVMSQITHRGRRGFSAPGERPARLGLRRPRDGEPRDPARPRPGARSPRSSRPTPRRRAASSARGSTAPTSALRASPDRPVLGAVGEPADRRVRREPREPPPLLGRGHPGDPGRRRAGLHPRPAGERRRADSRRPPSRGRGRDREGARRARRARLLHRLRLDRRDAALSPEAHAVRRHGPRPLRLVRGAHQAGGARGGDLRGARRRPAPRRAPPRGGSVRPGRDDARADGRPLDAAEGRRGASRRHPDVRRDAGGLPRPVEPRAHALLLAESGDRPRGRAGRARPRGNAPARRRDRGRARGARGRAGHRAPPHRGHPLREGVHPGRSGAGCRPRAAPALATANRWTGSCASSARRARRCGSGPRRPWSASSPTGRTRWSSRQARCRAGPRFPARTCPAS